MRFAGSDQRKCGKWTDGLDGLNATVTKRAKMLRMFAWHGQTRLLELGCVTTNEQKYQGSTNESAFDDWSVDRNVSVGKFWNGAEDEMSMPADPLLAGDPDDCIARRRSGLSNAPRRSLAHPLKCGTQQAESRFRIFPPALVGAWFASFELDPLNSTTDHSISSFN